MILYMVGKLAPNSTHSTRGLVKYVPDRAIFVPSSLKTGTNLLHPLPPQSLNGSLVVTASGVPWKPSTLLIQNGGAMKHFHLPFRWLNEHVALLVSRATEIHGAGPTSLGIEEGRSAGVLIPPTRPYQRRRLAIS